MRRYNYIVPALLRDTTPSFFRRLYSTRQMKPYFNSVGTRSEPLFTEEAVRNKMEEFKRCYPSFKTWATEFPPTDAGGYWIVNASKSACK